MVKDKQISSGVFHYKAAKKRYHGMSTQGILMFAKSCICYALTATYE